MTQSEHNMEYTTIGGTLRIPRIINGLWQLAGGHDRPVDVDGAVEVIDAYASAGFNCFDMADHYGDAELVIGRHNSASKQEIAAFTKWCPVEDGDISMQKASAAVDLSLQRMGQKKIALLQYHVWDYTDDTYLHNMNHLSELQSQGKVEHIGLTNVDAAHLELLLHSGFRIASNQVSCSVLDRRVERGRLGKLCRAHNVSIIAYGTLLGGFMSEMWLGQLEPTDTTQLNWSLRKYLRFIQAAGGWDVFQEVLEAVATIARRHAVPIAAVAMRYALDTPGVSAIIIGTRLSQGSVKYLARLKSVFSFQFDSADKRVLTDAQAKLKDIPGDCGDEYRRPPFLTAAGDLSHHLRSNDVVTELPNAMSKNLRIEYSSGGKFEAIAGYCRAVRTGQTIRVSGTVASSPLPNLSVLGGQSARAQTTAIFDKIGCALKHLQSSLSDVVRIRIIVPDAKDTEEVIIEHGRIFGLAGVRPTNTLILAGLISKEFLVEIEAEAEVMGGQVQVLSLSSSGARSNSPLQLESESLIAGTRSDD